MEILILGGTIFLGRHLVHSAISRGHSVTLFNRGKHNPHLFPEVEKLLGDRDGDLETLTGRKFDSVIDTCGYVPRIVKMSARFLKANVNHYTFISSISVYKNFSEPSLSESSETGKLEDESVEEITGETYGALKYLCEKEVVNFFKESALIIRPGLIVGENDPSDRFTYWVHRINQGGRVLLPDAQDKNIQFIDVKDLADWTIKMAEEKNSGVYNATGPDYDLKFKTFIDECRKLTGVNLELEWVAEDFLLEENVAPYTELPLWLPEDAQGGNNVNIRKALNEGLTFRPLGQTVHDTLQFDKSRDSYTLCAGLTSAREKELLEKWSKESASANQTFK